MLSLHLITFVAEVGTSGIYTSGSSSGIGGRGVAKQHGDTNCSLTMSGRYGSEAGREELRESIAGAFYGDTVIKPSEIFVSDGSKCDIGRLQMMFGSQASVALQVQSVTFRCHVHHTFSQYALA
jgi:CxxC motif-containing protein (DUF1111 family)